ncbi:MAG TPA: class I SAM-dependent methyltransferase [Pyrinomonadaceae bacterium]|nr:class I SAM-dependent methyltransferase [Pyrinomonadaceae bacterium]
MVENKYLSIISHYEACLEQYGDSHLGVDWPKAEDVQKRYRVMLEVIRPQSAGQRVSLLDFGCGAAHLNEYIREQHLDYIEYTGLDLSEKFVRLSQNKFPGNKFFVLDLLDENASLPVFDYIVLNGVFTEKRELSFDEMLSYFKQLVRRVFAHAAVGIAFNVMSKHVDWERDDLFHLPFDILAGFLKKELGRNFVFRNDYGLYEYTTYVYHEHD